MDDENANHCERVEERVAVSRPHHKVTGLKCLRLCDKYDWLNDGAAAGNGCEPFAAKSFFSSLCTYILHLRDKHSA